jgi:hypothetical protein
VNDRILAVCELSKDLLFEKIPDGKTAYYADASLAAGRAAAEVLRGGDIFEIYAENKIAIIKRAAPRGKFVFLRGLATMSAKECSVEIYEDSIRELATRAGMDYGLAERAHLAHELFHILEYKNGKSFSDELEKVTTVKIFGRARKAKINACEEVAAHAFAKELTDLEFLPNYYDYLYLIQVGKITREAFGEKLRACADSLKISALEGVKLEKEIMTWRF